MANRKRRHDGKRRDATFLCTLSLLPLITSAAGTLSVRVRPVSDFPEVHAPYDVADYIRTSFADAGISSSSAHPLLDGLGIPTSIWP